MAKKIIVRNTANAVKVLKTNKIEHALIQYKSKKDDKVEKEYILVKNIYKDKVVELLKNDVVRINNKRHYERLCYNHFKTYYSAE